VPDCKVARTFHDGHPVFGAGEPDAVELPQHLGEKVRPGERRPLLRDGVNCDFGGFGQHLIGQVTGVQQRQVVTPGQGFYPCNRVRAQHFAGSTTPPVN